MTAKNPGFKANHFDIIVTNPPFGANVKKSEHPYIETYKLGQNGKKIRDNQKTEILFIERCVEFLKSGTGKMAIVLPDSIAVNSSLQYVRDYILEHTQVLGIVSLPDFAFSYYGANVKSSLVFLRRKNDGEETDAPIFMASAERVGYTATGKDDDVNDLDVIRDCFATYEKTGKLKVPKGYEQKIYLVDIAEVVGRRIDVKGYAPQFKLLKERISHSKLPKRPLSELIKNTQAGEWGLEPTEVPPDDEYVLCYVLRNTNFDNNFNLNLADVAERYIPKDKVAPLQLNKNDILVEKSGGSPVQPVGRVALIQDLPTDKPVVYSNFLQKIVINEEEADPAYVYAYLQSLYRLGYMEYIQNQTTGIKNLLTEDFNAIEVLVPDKKMQVAIADELITTVQKVKKQIDEARQKLSDTRDGLIGRIL